jgi:hypothetical protein
VVRIDGIHQDWPKIAVFSGKIDFKLKIICFNYKRFLTPLKNSLRGSSAKLSVEKKK